MRMFRTFFCATRYYVVISAAVNGWHRQSWIRNQISLGSVLVSNSLILIFFLILITFLRFWSSQNFTSPRLQHNRVSLRWWLSCLWDSTYFVYKIGLYVWHIVTAYVISVSNCTRYRIESYRISQIAQLYHLSVWSYPAINRQAIDVFRRRSHQAAFRTNSIDSEADGNWKPNTRENRVTDDECCIAFIRRPETPRLLVRTDSRWPNNLIGSDAIMQSECSNVLWFRLCWCWCWCCVSHTVDVLLKFVW